MAKDPGYAELLKLQKERKLKSNHPTVIPRACLHQTPDMLLEDYLEESTGIIKKKFKDDLSEWADEEGRFWVEKGREDFVRRVLREYRVIDPSVYLDPGGLQLPEDMPAPNKGGRPNNGPGKKSARPDTGLDLDVG